MQPEDQEPIDIFESLDENQTPNTPQTQAPNNYDVNQQRNEYQYTPGLEILPNQNQVNNQSYDWISNYPSQDQPSQSKNTQRFKKITLTIITVLILAVVSAIALFIFNKNKPKVANEVSSQTQPTQNDNYEPNQFSNDTQELTTPDTGNQSEAQTPVQQPETLVPSDQPATQNNNQPSSQPATNQNNQELDNLRKQKLKAISQKLTDYYNAYGQFPTYAQATDENWLNSMSIKKEDLIDPGGTDWHVKNTPTKNYFSYQPLPNGCNNTNSLCTDYKLTSVLSDGKMYVIYTN